MINRYLFIILFCLVLFYTFTAEKASVATPSIVGSDSGSWAFNYSLAKIVFAQGDKQFGYYIFSPDEFGYSPRYAMQYVQKQQPAVQAVPYQKEPITYLLISPPGGKDGGIAGDWWKTHRVHITTKPEKVWKFKNGFRIEKYHLSKAEIAIPSDPNLIQSLIFR